MAAILPTQPVKKVPLGTGWLVMGTVVPSGTGAASDWIAKEKLGLTRIISAQAILGYSTAGSRVCLQFNAQGTGQAEGSSPGDLGFEISAGGTFAMNFIVYGEGRRMVPNG